MTESNQLRYRAFLLGPDRYDDPHLDTPKSVRANLDAMRRFLVEGPFAVARPNDVIVSSKEHGVEMKSKLANWFASATADEVLVFYYTGHGVGDPMLGTVFPLPGSGTDQLARLTPNDIRAFCHTARRAKVFVILDACRANSDRLELSDGMDHVYWMMASFAEAVDDSADSTRASPFTHALIAALSEVRNDTDTKVKAEVVRRGLTKAPVIRHASWELDEVPLRRVATRFPQRPNAASPSKGSGGVGMLIFLIIAVVGCNEWLSNDSGRASSAVGTTVVSAGPSTSASQSAAGSTAVPRAATMAAMDLGLAQPIVTPVCDGRWVVQIAAIDASDRAVAAQGIAPFIDAGAAYSYAPLGCGPLPNSGDRYVVFFGAYSTDTDARAACDAYGAECFVRRLA